MFARYASLLSYLKTSVYHGKEQTTTEAQDSSEHETSRPAPAGLHGRTHPWTLTHGFYATMGGFALAREDAKPTDPPHYLPSWQRNGVLTPKGVLLVIEHAPNSIPDIDVQDLLDRSKADGLAKILLVWQVVWFCLSCLNRAVQGLPLCLLEVATLAHAFCALLTYAFWWKKPKDVGQPTVLEGDEIRPLGAFMSVVSPARRFVVAGMITLTYSSEFEKGILEHLRTADPLLDPGLLSLVRGWQAALSHSLSMMLGALSLRREPPRYLGALKARCIFRGKIWPWYIQDGTSLPNAELDRCTARLQLFIGAQQCPVDPYDVGVVYVAPVASLQSFSISLDSDRFVRSFLAILVLAAAYGLPHLIGFKALFTTTTEQQMWQVATILILAAGAALSVLFVVLFVLKELLWDLSSTLDSIFGFLLSDSLLYGMFSLGLIVYFSSSAYLVAESFRQLSALPPESFILPSWGNYWPHFA